MKVDRLEKETRQMADGVQTYFAAHPPQSTKVVFEPICQHSAGPLD